MASLTDDNAALEQKAGAEFTVISAMQYYIQDELEGHKHLGESHLVHADGNGNNKIYVMTWSDIFDEFSKRHDYLISKMEIEKEIWLKKHNSVDETVEDIIDTSATLEPAFIPKCASK